MKIILSRKGFDDQYGGSPSPLIDDKRLISIPIPDHDDKIKYCDLNFENSNYEEMMKQLRIHKRYLSKTCHLDPDLYRDIYGRMDGWKPIFGQIGGRQTHLKKQKVGKNDLFLFYGSFRRVEQNDQGKLSFVEDSKPFHAIFGYLQIEEIKKDDFPDWMKYHPHVSSDDRRNNVRNAIYVSREKADWDSNIPGAGPLNFHKKLVLTKEGCSKSKWNLDPEIFKGLEISYHTSDGCKKSPWRDGYFKSADKGQEFVIEENKKVTEWAKRLIELGTKQ